MKHLTTLLLTLLVLGGCSSELDRCMKANQSTEKEIRENIKDLCETTDKYGLVIYPVSCMNEKLEYIKKRNNEYAKEKCNSQGIY